VPAWRRVVLVVVLEFVVLVVLVVVVLAVVVVLVFVVLVVFVVVVLVVLVVLVFVVLVALALVVVAVLAVVVFVVLVVLVIVVLMATGALAGAVAEEDTSTFNAKYTGNVTSVDELTSSVAKGGDKKQDLYDHKCQIKQPDVTMYFAMVFDRTLPAQGCLTSALTCVGTPEEDTCDLHTVQSCDEFRSNCTIQHSDDVSVNIQGVEKRKGTLRMAVASSKKEWNRGEVDWDNVPGNQTTVPDDCNDKCEVKMTVRNVQWGVRAVVVLHDENDNFEMDTKWYGPPKEGMLASNSAEGGMGGGPKWGDSAFLHVGQATEQTVDIWYP